MKRVKKRLSILLAAAIVISSISMGFAQLKAVAYSDASGTGCIRITIHVPVSDCGNANKSTDDNFTLQLLDSSNNVISTTPTGALSGAGTNLNSDTTTTYDSTNTPSLGTMTVNKNVAGIALVDAGGGDDWVMDSIMVYYDNGSDYQSIASGSWSASSGRYIMTTTWFSSNVKTLIFNANGGTGGGTYDAIPNQTISAPDAGTYTGHTFMDWGSVPARMSNANATYMATWIPNFYTIIYFPGDGTGQQMTSSHFYYDTAYQLSPNSYNNPGYVFAGWALGSKENPVTYSDMQSIMNLSATNGAIIDLYAKWTPTNYTITYNGNSDGQGGTTGISGWTPDSTHTYNQPGQLSYNGFTRAGYIFEGWALTPGGDVAYANSEEVVNVNGSGQQGAVITLYAKWIPITYYIAYDHNTGGIGFMDNTIHTYDIYQELPANTFTRMGYRFIGWGTGSWTGVEYLNQEAVINLTTADLSTVTLFAQWSANRYMVTFSTADGCMVTPSYKMVTFGSPYGTLPTPTKTGYTFVGWNTSPTGTGTNIVSTRTVTVAADQTLYAMWSSSQVTITFDANGGTGGTSTLWVTGETLTAPTVTKPGYTLVGWSPTLPSTVPAVDTTYIAIWAANSYLVTFEPQGGSVSPAAITVTYDSTYGTLPTPTKSGYIFGGWYTSANGSGTNIVSSTPVTITADQTLYAKWSIALYTVTFDCGSGFDFGMGPPSYTCSPGTIVNVDQLGLINDNQPYVAPGHLPEKDGYTFMGWAFASAPTEAVHSFVMPEADVTLYAIWQADGYQVLFDANGGSGTMFPQIIAGGQTAVLSSNTFTKTGYTFAGWATTPSGPVAYSDGANFTMGSSNVTLYAQWVVNTYSVMYDGNGQTSGSMPGSMCVYDVPQTLSMNSFVKTGYTFLGWALSPTGNVVYTDGDSVLNLTSINNGTVTLYAKWTANSYLVAFDAQGGSVSPATKTVTYNSIYGTLPTPTKTGCTFIGWFTSADDGTMITSTTTVTTASSQTLYARWIVNQYTVTFNTNGGSSVDPISQNYGAAVSQPVAPVKSGYTFEGWYLDSALTTAVTWPYTMGANNVTFYAKWSLTLAAPTSVASTGNTDTTVSLTWNAVANAEGYNVYCGTQKLNETPVTSTAFTATGLTADTEYSFTVTAVCGSLESPASTALAVKTSADVSDAIHFTVSNATGTLGETITVSVNITENSNIAAATIELPFDPALLEYVSAVKGSALSDSMTSIHYDEANHKITLTVISTEPLTAGGSILDIQFKIKTDSSPQTIQTNFAVIDLVNASCEKLPYTVTQGAIEIKYLLGDVNNDGTINVVDALMALHHVSGYRLLNSTQALAAADVDKNGVINIIDALKILQFASGSITSF